jgi:hypothetical protein
MTRVPDDLKGAVIGFVVLLSKGLLDNEKWDWDIERFDWQRYQEGFCDPTILRTTLAVFLNNLQIDDHGAVVNYENARFRGFQYFRSSIDPVHPFTLVSPPFASAELAEPDVFPWEC